MGNLSCCTDVSRKQERDINLGSSQLKKKPTSPAPSQSHHPSLPSIPDREMDEAIKNNGTGNNQQKAEDKRGEKNNGGNNGSGHLGVNAGLMSSKKILYHHKEKEKEKDDNTHPHPTQSMHRFGDNLEVASDDNNNLQRRRGSSSDMNPSNVAAPIVNLGSHNPMSQGISPRYGPASVPGNDRIIVVLEPENRSRKDSEDLSKSRSICKSIEKSIEDKAIGYKNQQMMLHPQDEKYHDYLFSANTEKQKNERSILKTKHDLENYPSGRTIDVSQLGKVKDLLKITKVEDMTNTEAISETRYVKAVIQLYVPFL